MKRPKPSTRFSWSRTPVEGGTLYRLFRRDFTRRVHFKQITLQEGMSRSEFACALRKLHHVLLDEVDAVDFKLLGVA